MSGEIGYLSVPSVETLGLPMEDGYMTLHSRLQVTRLPTSVSTHIAGQMHCADEQVTTLLSVLYTPLALASLLPPTFRSDAHRSPTSS